MTVARDPLPLPPILTDGTWAFTLRICGADETQALDQTGQEFDVTFAPAKVPKPDAGDVHNFAWGSGKLSISTEAVTVSLVDGDVSTWKPGLYAVELRRKAGASFAPIYLGVVDVARGLSQLATLGGGGSLPAPAGGVRSVLTQGPRVLVAGPAAAVSAEVQANVAATAADRVQTGQDRVGTGQDRTQTGLDRVATGQDKTATAADRVQTGQDRVATGQDRTQTGLDRVATGQDKTATAADRVQTGQDRVATGQDRVAVSADRAAADIAAGQAVGAAGTSPLLSGPKLKRTFRQLYLNATLTGGPPAIGTRPPANVLRVGVVGDSVGGQKPGWICQQLRKNLGWAGGFYNGAGLAGGATSNANFNDPTYSINGLFHTVPAGGSVDFLQGGGRPVCDVVKVYYVKEPGAGTFKVQTNSGAGYVDEASYVNVDASNASLGLGVITLTKATGRYSVKVVGLTGTVHILPAAYLDNVNGGVAEFHFDQGGWALQTAYLSPPAIRLALFNDLALDLAFIEVKDQSTELLTAIPGFFDWYRANVTTPTDWVFIGTSPVSDSTADTDNRAGNALFASYAAANGLVYFDGYTPLVSYANLVALGWQGDGTHLAVPANAYLANLLWLQLGLGALFGVASGRAWRLDGEDARALVNSKIIFGDVDQTWQASLYSDNFELIFKGGRGVSFRDPSGNGKTVIRSDGTNGLIGVQTPALALVTAGGSGIGNGPCLRPLGTSDTSGIYVSSIAPGNGTGVGPFMASAFWLNSATTGPSWQSGAGSPEGGVTARIGSQYSRTDGGAGTSLYVKESGTGNTGWVAK